MKLNDFWIYGSGWEQPIPKAVETYDSDTGIPQFHLLIAHRYIWTANTGHATASAGAKVTAYFDQLQGYNFAHFGDNHIPFEAACGDCVVINTGGFMRRGFIVIGGDAGDFPGMGMLAGTIVILGRAGVRAGATMRRGTVILMNETELLPSFFENALLHSPAIDMVLKRAASFGLAAPAGAAFRRFHGDVNTVGKGEILVKAS